MISWKNWLQSLTEKSFFNLYRNYLGNIETPYHKPDLISRFTQWMKSTEIQNKILDRINAQEAQILSAIHYLPLGGVKSWKSLSRQSSHFEEILENLKERLLILQSPVHQEMNVNPLLLTAMKDRQILGIQHLLSIKNESISFEGMIPGNPFFTALLCLLNRDDRAQLNQGEWSKKLQESLEKPFLEYHFLQKTQGRIQLLNSLVQMGLLELEGEKIRLCSSVIMAKFGDLSPWEKRKSLLISDAPKKYRMYLAALLDWMKVNAPLSLHEDDWNRLFLLCFPHWDSLDSWPIKLLKQWKNLGFLDKKGQNIFIDQRWFQEEQSTIPPLIQPNGDIHLTPEAPFCWVLPYTTRLLQSGSFTQLHFDKSSFQLGCPYHVRSKQWIETMEGVTGYPLISAIKTPLSDWDQEFFSMEIHRVLMLQLSKGQTSLVEAAGILAPYILGRTEEQGWLLSEDTKQQWLPLLEELGIHYYPKRNSNGDSLYADLPQNYPPLDLILSSKPKPILNGAKQWLEVKEEDLKDLDDFTRKEILSRIERNLILDIDQIRPAILPTELRQARGFDFNGKIRLIEMALTPPFERLEVIVPDQDGEPQEISLLPIELLDKGPQAILKAQREDSREEIILPVRKMLQLQRFPKSLI